MIVAWGEVLWDEFPDRERHLGGAPANFAMHAAALGREVALVSRVGDDLLGRKALAELSRRGVRTDWIQYDDSLPTGTVRIELTGDEPSFEIREEVAWDGIEYKEGLAVLSRDAELFYFGTLAQRSGATALREALACLPSNCIRFCDLNLRPPHHENVTFESATVVKLSSHDAELLDVDDPIAWLLEKTGVELVALTRGPHGSTLASRSHRADHPGFPEPVVNPVGAGDAFAAALAHELLRGTDLALASERCNRYAARTVRTQRHPSSAP